MYKNNKVVREVLGYVSRTYPTFHTAKQIAHACHIEDVRGVAYLLSHCNCITTERTRKFNRYTLKGKYGNPLKREIVVNSNMKKIVRILAVISNAYPEKITSDDISKKIDMTPMQIGGLLKGLNCIEYGKKGHLRTYKLIHKWGYEDED